MRLLAARCQPAGLGQHLNELIRWIRHPRAWPDTARLDVAGYIVTVRLTAAEMLGVLLPFLLWLDAIPQRLGRRALVGLAGPPGSGKTTLAALIRWLWSQFPTRARLACLSIDGWHLPNAELDRRTFRLPDGTRLPLRARKGSPGTFDVPALVAALQSLKTSRAAAVLPRYDRTIHEPVSGAVTVDPDTDLILLEGNYVLLQKPPWHRVRALMDAGVFIEIDPSLCRRDIIERHRRGGLSHAQAVAKYDSNDAANTSIVMPTRAQADLVLRFDHHRRLVAAEHTRHES